MKIVIVQPNKRVSLESLKSGDYFSFPGGFTVFCKTDCDFDPGKIFCFNMENGTLPWFPGEDMVLRMKLVSDEAIKFEFLD